MKRKLREPFAGGAQLVWHIDHEKRRVKANTAVDQFSEVGAGQTLEGGTALPGFSLRLAHWFSLAGERAGRETE